MFDFKKQQITKNFMFPAGKPQEFAYTGADGKDQMRVSFGSDPNSVGKSANLTAKFTREGEATPFLTQTVGMNETKHPHIDVPNVPGARHFFTVTSSHDIGCAMGMGVGASYVAPPKPRR